MISTTSRDHTFRRTDLSIFPGLESPSVPVACGIGDGRVVAGHAKAAQNFLKALMTPLGHYRGDPDYGSEFTSRVAVGGNVYPEELPNVFAVEALRVLEHSIATKGPDQPDDEVVVRAELADYAVGRGSVDLRIELHYRNGDVPVPILLPIQLRSQAAN